MIKQGKSFSKGSQFSKYLDLTAMRLLCKNPSKVLERPS